MTIPWRWLATRLLAIVALTLLLKTSCYEFGAGRDVDDLRRLAKEGKLTTALVTEDVSTKADQMPRFKYRLELPGYSREQTALGHLQPGARLEVLYLPSNPSVHRLVFEKSSIAEVRKETEQQADLVAQAPLGPRAALIVSLVASVIVVAIISRVVYVLRGGQSPLG